MSRTLTFEIRFLSDYHIGAGYSTSEVDSALFRDEDHIPAIRGTVLAALLRDATRRMVQSGALTGHSPKCQASGLDEDDKNPRYCGQFHPEPSPCPVCQVFGSPHTIKPWAISSARPKDLIDPLTQTAFPHAWGSQGTMQVRIDPISRRSEARKLFSREDGGQRLAFQFSITCNAPDAELEKETALLIAAARFVRNLGASRRRGRGECLISLISIDDSPADQQQWLDKFNELWLNAKLTREQPSKPHIPQKTVPELCPVSGQPFSLRLTIRTDEPLLVARRSQAGNEFESLGIIPGSVLRGAFAARASYLAEPNQANARSVFTEIFFKERIMFPFLYPAKEVQNVKLQAYIPAPRDLHTCKRHSNFDQDRIGILWHLGMPGSQKSCPRCQQVGQETELEAIKGFLLMADTLENPALKRRIEMHNRISPETGRVAESDLFGYEAIPSGQFLIGELRLADRASWETLRQACELPEIGKPFSLRLGKASRRGYGAVTAVFDEYKGDAPIWIRQKLEDRIPNSKNGPITITLLTDTVILDRWGRFCTNFDKDWLEQALGIKVKVDDQYVATRLIDGFNLNLGLPRWRDVALAAGSAAQIQPADGLAWNLENLKLAEFDGIGLRRNEGFGRLAFNHPAYQPATAPFKTLSLNEALNLSDAASTHFLTVEQNFLRSWEQELDNLSFRSCTNDKFRYVARLLRLRKESPIPELNRLLSKLGDRNNLKDGLPLKEDNWFASQGKGKDGIEQICLGLKALDNLLDSYGTKNGLNRQRLSMLGVNELAEKIAMQVRRSGTTAVLPQRGES
jgi:CRISPR-associated protein Csx10